MSIPTAPKEGKLEQLGGARKAALLLLSIDMDVASNIMSRLNTDEIEKITSEISNIKSVPAKMVSTVLEEFKQMIQAQEYVIEGGVEYAGKLLESSLGFLKATEILERVKTKAQPTMTRGFNILKKVDSIQLATFLQKEHPQTIAIVLSQLAPEHVAQVLLQMDDDLRSDVVYRMATLGKIAPTLLAEMEEVIGNVAEAELTTNASATGGVRVVAQLLNKCSSAVAKGVLEQIEKREPGIAGEIKRLMLLFEDLLFVDDRGIQRILRDVDRRDLAMALKVSDERLKAKIFQNMSEGMRQLVKEELDYMGPVRVKDVQDAQVRILDIVKALADKGEIFIAGRGGMEETFV
ncbi:MAG: flagellar motor switch protein FliG [Ignavibacteria bacterium]|nr:flagellar motor switch protein FliG [Ignavibacteria bacterium]